MSGHMPWSLVTALYTDMYRARGKIRRGYLDTADGQGGPRVPSTPKVVQRALRAQRSLLRQQKIEEWERSLAKARAGLYAVGALCPIFREWLGQKHGFLSYRMVTVHRWPQVLTGHGCFGEYLHRIQREESARCHHCDSPEDMARHTLKECPAWAEERRALQEVVGEDVSLPAVLKSMVEGDRQWQAMVSWEQVMLQKKTMKRERGRKLLTPSLRGEEKEGGRAEITIGVPNRNALNFADPGP